MTGAGDADPRVVEDMSGLVTSAEIEAAGRARVRQLIAANRFGLWQITDPARIQMAVDQCWANHAADMLPSLRAAAAIRATRTDGAPDGR